LNIFSTKDDFLRLSDLEEDTEDVVELFNFFFRGEQKSGDLKVPLCCLGLKFELKSVCQKVQNCKTGTISAVNELQSKKIPIVISKEEEDFSSNFNPE
jgi:hypothetical protein